MAKSLCAPNGSCKSPGRHSSMDCYAKYLDLSDPECDNETYEEWQRTVSQPLPQTYRFGGYYN
jgi:hypothetical protein